MSNRCVRLLLDFDACAQRDSTQASVFLHRRDRKFALTSDEEGEKRSAQRWMDYINRFSDTSSQAQQTAQSFRFWRRVTSGFIAAGALFGILTMLGLLFYDGAQRINITVILAFVVFQVLLGLFTTVQSIVGWQPWRALLRRFQQKSQSTITAKLQPVLMARAAHLGGICFAVAGLASLLVMVVLQDLAFGWSTTLETNAGAYHALITWVAAPWAWFWPLAAPDLGLVEATRFFRAGTTPSNIEPASWGQWWPFVAMLWTTYVLAPRLILFFVARWLIQRKATRLLAQHPAMQALIYRMETPTLDTGNEQNDASDLPDLSQQLALTSFPKAPIVLSWAGAGESQLPHILTQNKHIIAKVGGRLSLAEDQKTVDQVATQLAQEPSPSVLLVTRSWEPPTGELEDFICNAKELWPKSAHIVVIPLATNPALEPNKQHVQQWLRFAQRMQAGFVSVSIIPVTELSPEASTQHQKSI